MGHSCRTLLWDTLVEHSSYETSSKKSHVKSPKRAFRTRLPPKVTCQVSKNEGFVRDFLQKSRAKSPKRAFRTRLPPKLTCQSLQNEHFVRDFLQKSSGNTHRKHTHHAALPSSFASPAPSKQYPLTRQSHCDIDIHLYHNSRPHNSLRLPRIFPRPHV